jgi:prolyl-tRNA synthetase
MGSYGIGPGRVLATIVELRHDEKGITWPKNVAPYQIMLIGLNLEKHEIKKQTEELYEKLLSENIEILYDDREDITAGQKFADCDLIGIPYRAVVSQKTKGLVELKKRNEKESSLVSLEELPTQIK